MASRKDFDPSSRIVTIHLTSRKEPLRLHCDLIKECYPRADLNEWQWVWFWFKAPSPERHDQWFPDPDCVDKHTLVTFVRWLYTGAVEFSNSYFNTVVEVLKMASDTARLSITRSRRILSDFHNALIDHTIGMIKDPDRESNVPELVSMILNHKATDGPNSGLGLFLADWIVYGGCEVASVFADFKDTPAGKHFLVPIATKFLAQKAAEWQDATTLPWNGDPCRYHVGSCGADACAAYREQSTKGHVVASGVSYQSKAPKKEFSKRAIVTSSENDDGRVPEKKLKTEGSNK